MSHRNAESREGFIPNASPDRPLPPFTAQRLALLPTARIHHVGTDLSFGLRIHQQALAALCKDPFLEQRLLEEVNAKTHQETKTAVEQGQIYADCVAVGTGPAGVSLASRIRELLPSVRLWMVDERDYRGGQFADPGYDYLLNTPLKGQKLGFPGELDDFNNLGSGVFLQLKDITHNEEYPRRKKLATCLQIDGFVAAPALVGTKVVSVDVPTNPNNPCAAHALDKNTSKRLVISPKVVVFARGRGKPKYGIDITVPDTQEALAQRRNNIYVSEAFNTNVDGLSPQMLFDEIKNGLAFIGAGDSTNTALDAIIVKLLTIYSPEEIKKLSIDVYGAKYTNGSDFGPSVRIPRYNAIIPYIGTLIRPREEKAQGLLVAGNNSVGVTTATSLGIYRTVAMMTGYQNVPMEELVNKTDGAVRSIDIFGEGELEGELIAQQIEGKNIFSVGVDVPEKFPGRPPVFSRSIVRHTPRVLATAEKIVDILQAP